VPLYHGILPPDSLFGFENPESGPTGIAPYDIGAGW
jgi:hypothetical protein